MPQDLGQPPHFDTSPGPVDAPGPGIARLWSRSERPSRGPAEGATERSEVTPSPASPGLVHIGTSRPWGSPEWVAWELQRRVSGGRRRAHHGGPVPVWGGVAGGAGALWGPVV